MYPNIYLLLKFLHITAAIMMFACWSIDWLLISFRNEGNQKGNDFMARNLKNNAMLQKVSVLTLVGTGIWLSIAARSFPAWTASAIIAIVLMELLSGVLPRYADSRKHDRNSSAGNSGSKPQSLMKSVVKMRIAIGSGIVALMTLKPQTILHCTFIVIAAVLAAAIWALIDIKKQSLSRSS